MLLASVNKFQCCCLQISGLLLTNFRAAAYKFQHCCLQISANVRKRKKIRQGSKGSQAFSYNLVVANKFQPCCLQISGLLLTNFRLAAYKFRAAAYKFQGMSELDPNELIIRAFSLVERKVRHSNALQWFRIQIRIEIRIESSLRNRIF